MRHQVFDAIPCVHNVQGCPVRLCRVKGEGFGVSQSRSWALTLPLTDWATVARLQSLSPHVCRTETLKQSPVRTVIVLWDSPGREVSPGCGWEQVAAILLNILSLWPVKSNLQGDKPLGVSEFREPLRTPAEGTWPPAILKSSQIHLPLYCLLDDEF